LGIKKLGILHKKRPALKLRNLSLSLSLSLSLIIKNACGTQNVKTHKTILLKGEHNKLKKMRKKDPPKNLLFSRQQYYLFELK
jgi:hypothetical protein